MLFQLYNAGAGKTAQAGEIISSMGIHADPRAQGVVAMLAIAANVICIAVIIKRSVAMGKSRSIISYQLSVFSY